MDFIKGKVVLITGAAGSIGSALSKTIAKQKPKLLVLLDQDETGIFDIYEDTKNLGKVDWVIASIRDKARMETIFKKYKPEIVFHAAAYKHVFLMERDYYEVFSTNVRGTLYVKNAAIKCGTKKFIFISSDKAVNPESNMGLTKHIGERVCLEANETSKTKFIIVRFGNVMPSRGSVVPIFNKQIAEGKDLTVTDKNMRRFFMGIYEAVNLVIEAARIGKGGEIMVLDMGEPLYINELAKLMIKLSGKDLGIKYTKVAKGEKFKEELMTKEEAKRAVKKGKIYIIKNARRL